MSALSSTRSAGAPLARASGAVVLLHGRGATAESMLSLSDVLARPELAYIAPQAPGHTWYPYSFLAPIEQNEPQLSQSLASVGQIVGELRVAGFGAERVVLFGFSQGGCPALEYAARNAQRFDAVIGLSAGLIGPELAPGTYNGSFAGSRVFLGSSDVDTHIPLGRVKETAATMRSLGADVVTRIYPGMGHTINEDEVLRVRTLITRVDEPTEVQSQQRRSASCR
jgi:phospholipase/carboxylesterase